MDDLNLPALLKEFANFLENNGYSINARPFEIEEAITEFLEMRV